MLKISGQIEEETPRRGDENLTRKLVRACICVYLVLVIVVFAAIRRISDGHFLYSLDDPYIHLALAENIAHGHYGINAIEPSSPSSTIVWPLMLVPFAGTRWHSYLPLFWNVLFGTASSFLIGSAVARWMPMRRENGRSTWWKQLTTAVLLMMVANLVGLTFIGMEHALQILLSISCALGCIAVFEGRPVPAWCLVAAVLAPSVRYEDIVLTLAICVALWGRHERAKASVILGLSILPLILFGLFLKSQGLPMLPTSVMVKGNVYSGHVSFFRALARVAISNFETVPRWSYTSPIVAFFLIFLLLFVKEKQTVRRYIFLGAVLAAALQLSFGRFGWFYRYEVYVLIFLTLLLVRVAAERPPIGFGYLAIGLLLLARPYIQAIPDTIHSAQDIYGQQYQMHRFISSFYHGDFAVNDLGLVSFQKPADRYVLDVYGLASVEASRQSPKTAAWLEGIVRRHRVKLAILYPEWFDIPSSWIPEARVCLKTYPVVVAEQCMVFYSTTPEAAQGIREDLIRFAPTLPPNARMLFLPEEDEDSPKDD